MPKRQNNYFVTVDLVVDVVSNSVNLQAASAKEPRVLNTLANARLQQEEPKGRFQIFRHSVRGR